MPVQGLIGLSLLVGFLIGMVFWGSRGACRLTGVMSGPGCWWSWRESPPGSGSFSSGSCGTRSPRR